MMITLRYYRFFLLVLFGLSLFLLSASFYFEWVKQMAPCPLCIVQRIAVFGLVILYGILFFLKNRTLLITISIIQFFLSSLGLAAAGRQVWLTTLPQAPACVPNLSAVWHYLPLKEILKALLNGSGSCTENHWLFLGFSMPEWMCFFFSLFILAALLQGYKAYRNNHIY